MTWGGSDNQFSIALLLLLLLLLLSQKQPNDEYDRNPQEEPADDQILRWIRIQIYLWIVCEKEKQEIRCMITAVTTG